MGKFTRKFENLQAAKSDTSIVSPAVVMINTESTPKILGKIDEPGTIYQVIGDSIEDAELVKKLNDEIAN